MDYGDPDGHGRHGVLDEGPGGLLCHECGQERRFLGRHLRVHGLTADGYRQRHGLGRSTPLLSAELRERFSTTAKEQVGLAGWSRFAQARDPAAATEASRETSSDVRPGVVPGKRERAAHASRSRPRRVCTVDGCSEPQKSQGWCAAHLGRWLRTGELRADVPIRKRKP